MHSDKFEVCFSEFINGESYDSAQSAVFNLVRAAFAAGWQAAREDTDSSQQPTTGQ
jgi:hypothetical protein